MRNYELFLILEAKKDEAAAQKIVREVEAVLNKYGASIVKSHQGQSLRLAYQINKRRETYQVTLEVEADPSKLVEIKRNLNLIGQVLRFEFFALQAAA
ncbi:MAG: 30S ribosomal protein S6 [Candidatus Melainabacteria bacterium]|nr:30S ribosomal protein S6 [Candidatus Melainabacteria bacterium]